MIVARNISLSYEKNKNVLGNTSFHIKDKEFIIISGSSGSGKSTLLKAIYGNLAITEGSLTVNSVDITKKQYQKGVSCHHCIDNVSDEQRARYAEREKQMALASQRGHAHIGSDAAKTLQSQRALKKAKIEAQQIKK